MLLEIKKVSKLRSERTVLEEIDFSLRPGERWCILGASGSGKTTLLRLIAGLEAPDKGEIHLNNILASSPAEVIIPPYKRGLAFVFQTPSLWPHMTGRENIAFALGQDSEEITMILEETGGTALASRHPSAMSGGEQRCVEIARALAVKPRLLLLDEPFTHLDSAWKKNLLATIVKHLDCTDAALLHVTHNCEEATLLGCRQLRLRNGHLTED